MTAFDIAMLTLLVVVASGVIVGLLMIASAVLVAILGPIIDKIIDWSSR